MKHRANWELRRIVSALSRLPLLNSKEENKRLKQAKEELENRELKNALLNEAEKRGFNKDHLDKHLEVIMFK